ncbi:cathelicidin-1-like [Eubalaena glacialis]|uniref:cathelicidin-1-like n=1 Tax=Eubalaena glacialis TaxID=27606 RepID=UPI002A5A90D7|nr:cathelicidin-1-like [Eubalaena glacialis]XP_061051323.1 cathelicidin-1-like [Eubalaena glacialis]XP_061051324.1 cathelicidin-1-like [Eubalaena glacialis]XP_061051325.1 cathelicidin-1-like [Eubalaena glacialis]XP_061051326.1 cathelicidin-1-like [Eubalaena glacialis]XP_061051327.1 cathelicidin-1-like [Eubalaena glacialis]XP_061051328.1 cathelicidin-1-like [Eubalaena glacialis]
MVWRADSGLGRAWNQRRRSLEAVATLERREDGGGFPRPLPSNPVRQQQGLRQVQLTAGGEIRDGAGQEDAWLGHCIRPRRSIKEGPVCWEEADLGIMETQRASLALGRWPLWLLLLGLVVPSASAQTLSYREAVIRALDQLNERSSEANLYRLLELDLPPKTDGDPDTPKPVSFTVKETVCPRTTQQSPEQCDFKENGLVKQCVGTVTLNQVRGNFDITCNKAQSVRITKLPWAPPQPTRICRVIVMRVCR